MPYTTLYAIRQKNLEHYVGEVRNILEGDMQRMWPFLFKAFEEFRPPLRLSTSASGGRDKPYTQVSYYGSPAWEDLMVDKMPTTISDPRIQWLMNQVVLGTAEFVFNGGDDKFHNTFTLWIPDQNALQTAEDNQNFDWWCQNLFDARTPMPAHLSFLANPDAFHAYWTPDKVRQCAERERQTKFLETIAGRVRPGDWYNQLVAGELVRISRFIHFIEASDFSLYYCEYAT